MYVGDKRGNSVKNSYSMFITVLNSSVVLFFMLSIEQLLSHEQQLLDNEKPCILFSEETEIVGESVASVVDDCLKSITTDQSIPAKLLVSRLTQNLDVTDLKVASADLLSRLDYPWELPDKKEHAHTINEIYSKLFLINRLIDMGRVPKGKLDYYAEYAVKLDDAFANAYGLFNTANHPSEEKSDNLGQVAQHRIDVFAEMEKFPISSYASRAIRLRAHAHIIRVTARLGGTINDLSAALSAYDLILCRRGEQLFEKYCPDDNVDAKDYSFGSFDGWRWLDDIVFDRAVVLMLLGSFGEAKEMIEALQQWPAVVNGNKELNDKTHYRPLRKVVLDKIAQHIDKYSSYKEDGYIDQIYIHQFVPGLDASVNKHFSIRDLAGQMSDVLLEVQKESDVEALSACWRKERQPGELANQIGQVSPYSDLCLNYMDGVSQKLTKMMRKDNVVVIGSYRKKSDAQAQENRLVLVEKEIKEKVGNFSLRVQPMSGGLYRVRVSGLLSDSDVAKVVEILNRKNEESFVSRPTIP